MTKVNFTGLSSYETMPEGRERKSEHMQRLVTEGLESGMGSRSMAELRAAPRARILDGIQRGDQAIADGKILSQNNACEKMKKRLKE